MRARAPLALRRKGEEGGRARLSVDETGRTLRARRNKLDRRSGEGGCHPAASTRSNFALRLEHKLQTVVDGRAWRSRDSPRCSRYRRSGPDGGTRCRHTRRTASAGCPIPQGYRRLIVSHPSARCWRRSGAKPSAATPRFAWGHRGGRARCPDGIQPEPLTVSPPFLRPRTGNWQAGRGICRVAAVLRQPGGGLPTAHI
jgi:hypothetical protein